MSWKVPESQEGGVYKVQMSDHQLPSAVVSFRVREYNERKFEIMLDYMQESYSPGEEVQGKITVRYMDGSEIGEKVQVSIFGQAGLYQSNIKIDPLTGEAHFTFVIPEQFEGGAYVATYHIRNGDDQESKSDSITILQDGSLFIEFTGESGSIIPDIKNKVYFEAFSDDSKSEHVDIKGAKLIGYNQDAMGRTKKDWTEDVEMGIHTMHHGRGHFTFTPEIRKQYYLETIGSVTGKSRFHKLSLNNT